MKIKLEKKSFILARGMESMRLIQEEGKIKSKLRIGVRDYAILGVKYGEESRAFGMQITLLNYYNGSLEPLDYKDHMDEIAMGMRPKGYEGIKVRQGAREWVLIGKMITFELKEDSPNGSSLF